MGLIPKKAIDRVQFYEDHIAPFTTNATAIGITAAEVTDLQTKTAAARSGFDDQQAAKQSQKVATEAFQNLVDAMSTAGAALIKKIRAKAEQTGDPAVYTLSEIPAPATPTAVGAPGKPTDFTVSFEENGDAKMKWKCANPAGCTNVMYQVWRRTTPTGAFTYIGGTGERSITDSTLPAGSSQITYQIQGVRSTSVGPWAQFNVNIGVNGTSITEGQPSNIAV